MRRELTSGELAHLTGLDIHTVEQIEAGGALVPFHGVVDIAAAMEVPVAVLALQFECENVMLLPQPAGLAGT